MGYRIKAHPKPRPNRAAADVATPTRLFVTNGATTDFAFPCYYQEVRMPIPAHCHDSHWHDHIGWPGPDHPDHCCQLWSPDRHCCSIGMRGECSPHCERYVDLSKLIPIHLSSEYEGYERIEVAWATEGLQAPDGVTVTGSIDDQDDWVIRLHVDCMDPTAIEKPAKYKLSVFACNDAKRDIVMPAELVIMPSGYVE